MQTNEISLALLADGGIISKGSDGVGVLVTAARAVDLATNRYVALFRDDSGRSDAVAEQIRNAATAIVEDATSHRPESEGVTSLIVAALTGDEAVLDDLIARGAVVNATDDYDRTALFHAVRAGRTTVVQQLLRSGADPSLAAQHGLTPLIEAARRGHQQIVELLLAAGANPRSRHRYGGDARSLAMAAGHITIAALLPVTDSTVRFVDDASTQLCITANPPRWAIVATTALAVVAFAGLFFPLGFAAALLSAIIVALPLATLLFALGRWRCTIGPDAIVERDDSQEVSVPLSAINAILVGRRWIQLVLNDEPKPTIVSGRRRGRVPRRSRFYSNRTPDGTFVYILRVPRRFQGVVLTALARVTLGRPIRRPPEFEDWT